MQKAKLENLNQIVLQEQFSCASQPASPIHKSQNCENSLNLEQQQKQECFDSPKNHEKKQKKKIEYEENKSSPILNHKIENINTEDVEYFKFQMPQKRHRQHSFVPKTNFLARFFMVDLFKFLLKYSQASNNLQKDKSLELKDAPYLGKNDESTFFAKKFEDYIKKKNINDLSPFQILFKFFRIHISEFLPAIITSAIFVLLKLSNSILINVLLDTITDYSNENNGVSQFDVYLQICIICVIFLLGQVFMETNIGKLINLCSTDFNIVEIKTQPVIFAITLPIALIGSMIILLIRFGAIGLICLLVVLIGVILQVIAGGFYQKEAIKRSQINDQRVKLTNELIEGIRLIKMYAWEKEFKQITQVVRQKELVKTFMFLLYMYSGSVINHCITFVSLFVQILIFLKYNHEDQITTGKIFSTLELLNFMKYNMLVAILGLTGYKDFINIMIRAKQILTINETFMINIDNENKNQSQNQLVQKQSVQAFNSKMVVIKNFYGFWSKDQYQKYQSEESNNQQDLEKNEKSQKNQENQAVLKNINIEILKGEKIAIIGKIGAGKSSLLHTILQELPYYKGTFYCKGSIAYVEQEPYIFNGTVRDNIVLGSEFQVEKYEKVVKKCCLIQDFQELACGDMTEIGEKGINLSGGQKARISLARAVYQDADIYLLDDPFSAVDSKTGKKLNKYIMQGLLLNKTVIYATHQLHFTKDADQIIVLKDGKIEKQGLFNQIQQELLQLAGNQGDQLFNNNKDSNSQYSQSILNENLKKNNDKNVRDQLLQQMAQNQNKAQLSIDEQNEIVKVSSSAYLKYLKYAGGFLFVFILFSILIVDSGLFIYMHLIIGDIVDEEDKYKHLYYLGYFILLLISERIVLLLLANSMHIKAVKQIHNQLLKRMMHTKTSFFDQTPSGIIINRFSSDLSIIDITLFSSLMDSISLWVLILCLLIYISYINQWLIFVLATQIIFQMIFLRNSKQALKDSKKLDLQYKSPVFSFFSSALSGSLHIRIYKQIENFTQLYNNLVDDSFRSSYLYQNLLRAYTYISQIISTLSSVIGLILIVYLTVEGFEDTLQVGYIILYLILISDTIQYSLKQILNADISMSSAVRIFNYIKDLPQEKAYVKSKQENQENFIQNFAGKGDVLFKNISLKYRENTDPVIRNVTFLINSGEKVGCVGRTGAGKSSLIQALFRIHEIEDFDDNQNTGIFMGGKRIQDYGLKIVRNSMSIIPQTPFVFSGTIRNNLDPLKQYTDDQIIEVLKDIELFELVSSLPQGIQTDMTNVGSLFSTGQKQLICLGRCILKKSKILVLDEATANVDMKTDEFIQKKIKEKFSDCTVFTIAHRLNTIADYDKILVMEKGEVAEYDTPYNLLVQNVGDNKITKHQSIFAQMVKKTGHANSNQIFQIAYENYLKKQHDSVQ